MAKMWVTEYRVIGHGTFPVDMLRYDASYPSRSAERILEPERFWSMENAAKLAIENREVTLHHRDSHARWEPTFDRWASFGWVVDRSSIRSWSN